LDINSSGSVTVISKDEAATVAAEAKLPNDPDQIISRLDCTVWLRKAEEHMIRMGYVSTFAHSILKIPVLRR
jgi:hypothetical protein